MTLPTSWIRRFWSIAALSPVLAQSPDPVRRPVVVRTVLADGTPMPGVPIVERAGNGTATGATDGWLRCDSRRLALAARPVVGRSDPEGKIVVMATDGVLGPLAIEAAPPFQSQGWRPEGVEYVMQVARLEQFVVQAFDASGAPLIGLPLALQRSGHDEALAVTDACGFATFGVDPATSARLLVVPCGWVGPTDGFPTVAKQLPDKHLSFAVPPFGKVRVRAVVGGKAKAVPIRGASLHEPRTAVCSPSVPGTTVFDGVEFGPVAVGQVLRGVLRFDDGDAPFTAPAVVHHGDVVVVDVEADPARPRFELQLDAPGLRRPPPSGPQGIDVRVRVAVRTDAGEFATHVGIGDDGLLHVAFDRTTVLGRRLLRVDVDVEEQELAVGPAGLARRMRCWSGSRSIERALAARVMDLGVVAVAPHPGLLRGRVVDERGQPVPGAAIEVTDAPRVGATWMHWSDEQGRFELLGPLLRDRDGAVVAVVATASLGQGVDAVRSEPCEPVAAGSEVTLVLRASPRGFVELTLRDPGALPTHALQFEFVEAGGRVRELGFGRVAWGGERNGTCRLGPLRPGRGALRIRLRPGVLLRTVADLEIVDAAVCRDPRLSALDLSDVVSVRRMRIVDEAGVPMSGARVEYRGASDRWSIGPSDGGGMLDIVKGPPKALRIVVTAPGCQPVEVIDVVDGADIRMRPLPNLCVTVKGLPADVDRADLAVFLRSVVRENLADSSQAPLVAGDVANVPLPAPGRYHVRLTVRQKAGAGDNWTFVGQRGEDVLVAADGASIDFALDEGMLQRLRELRQK